MQHYKGPTVVLLFPSFLDYGQGVAPAQNKETPNTPPQNSVERDARKHYLVALEAIQNDDLAVATDELNRAAALAPGNALIWYNLAVVESKKGESKAALEHLHKATALGLPASQQEGRGRVAVVRWETVGRATRPLTFTGASPWLGLLTPSNPITGVPNAQRDGAAPADGKSGWGRPHRRTA